MLKLSIISLCKWLATVVRKTYVFTQHQLLLSRIASHYRSVPWYRIFVTLVDMQRYFHDTQLPPPTFLRGITINVLRENYLYLRNAARYRFFPTIASYAPAMQQSDKELKTQHDNSRKLEYVILMN